MSAPAGTFERLATWVLDHRAWLIGIVVGISAILGAEATQLHLGFEPGDLLPQQHPFVEVHNRYHRDFSETNVLSVMVEARDGTIFSVPALSKIWDVTAAVDALPGVNHDQVTSVAHRSTRWARVRAGGVIESEPMMLRAPRTEAEARAIQHLVVQSYALGTMVSLDQRAALIRAGFHEHHLDYRELFEAVQRRILPLADEHVAVYVSGQPRLNGWLLALQGQVGAAVVAAVVITWIALYAYFRDWRGALRPTISGGLAALWGFGLMRLTGFAVNPLTLVIPFLITARAVSHSAQMHDRYYEEIEDGLAKPEAIRTAFARLVVPTTAGIVTDALGVLAIGIVRIPALQHLAISATIWLLSLMLTELLLNPIVYTRLRAPARETIAARRHGRFARACHELAGAVCGRRGRWVTLATGAAVGATAIGLLPYVQIGDPGSASRMLAADAEYNRDHRAVQAAFGGSEPLMVVVEGDGRDALQRADVLHAIEAFQRYLERVPVVSASFSLVDVLKSMGPLFHEGEPKWAVIPTDDAALRTMFFTYWGTVYPSTSAQFFTPDFSAAPVTFFCRDHAVDHVRQLIAAARAFIAEHPVPHVRFRLAGGFIGLVAAIYDEIGRSQALMTAASFAIIFVIVAATYWSIVAAILLTVPLALANAVVNAYIGARGIGLDLDTLPVIAVGVGFGIDYGIYLVSRVQEMTRQGLSIDDAVPAAVEQSGRTVAFTALVMTMGILCFAFTSIRFVGEMAVLLALWMGGSALASLTVLPGLLLVTRPRFLR